MSRPASSAKRASKTGAIRAFIHAARGDRFRSPIHERGRDKLSSLDDQQAVAETSLLSIDNRGETGGVLVLISEVSRFHRPRSRASYPDLPLVRERSKPTTNGRSPLTTWDVHAVEAVGVMTISYRIVARNGIETLTVKGRILFRVQRVHVPDTHCFATIHPDWPCRSGRGVLTRSRGIRRMCLEPKRIRADRVPTLSARGPRSNGVIAGEAGSSPRGATHPATDSPSINTFARGCPNSAARRK